MTNGHGEDNLAARARLAGLLFLADNALYIVSFLASVAGPEQFRRPAVAFQAIASAGTIALAWAFYELLKPAGQGLALMALLFRVAEAALFGITAMFSVLLLSNKTGGLDQAGLTFARSARFASSSIGEVYFCAGSAVFFYLLFRSRFIPRAIAALGLVATMFIFASALAQIGAPALAGRLAFSNPLLLIAETVTGVWLLVVGAKPRPTQLRKPLPHPSSSVR
jgi:hypothetical protein